MRLYRPARVLLLIRLILALLLSVHIIQRNVIIVSPLVTRTHALHNRIFAPLDQLADMSRLDAHKTEDGNGD